MEMSNLTSHQKDEIATHWDPISPLRMAATKEAILMMMCVKPLPLDTAGGDVNQPKMNFKIIFSFYQSIE